MTQKLTAYEIQPLIAGSFQDASDYLNFMLSDSNNAEDWARINGVELERPVEYDEAVACIKIDFREKALIRMECDIKGREFDQDDSYLPLFRNATRDEIAAMAEKNYDEAAEEIAENGTLF